MIFFLKNTKFVLHLLAPFYTGICISLKYFYHKLNFRGDNKWFYKLEFLNLEAG